MRPEVGTPVTVRREGESFEGTLDCLCDTAAVVKLSEVRIMFCDLDELEWDGRGGSTIPAPPDEDVERLFGPLWDALAEDDAAQ